MWAIIIELAFHLSVIKRQNRDPGQRVGCSNHNEDFQNSNPPEDSAIKSIESINTFSAHIAHRIKSIFAFDLETGIECKSDGRSGAN